MPIAFESFVVIWCIWVFHDRCWSLKSPRNLVVLVCATEYWQCVEIDSEWTTSLKDAPSLAFFERKPNTKRSVSPLIYRLQSKSPTYSRADRYGNSDYSGLCCDVTLAIVWCPRQHSCRCAIWALARSQYPVCNQSGSAWRSCDPLWSIYDPHINHAWTWMVGQSPDSMSFYWVRKLTGAIGVSGFPRFISQLLPSCAELLFSPQPTWNQEIHIYMCCVDSRIAGFSSSSTGVGIVQVCSLSELVWLSHELTPPRPGKLYLLFPAHVPPVRIIHVCAK